MKTHRFIRSQMIRASLNEVWNFFSNPGNLSHITPPAMNFTILSDVGMRIHEGQLIKYKVTVLPLYTVTWITQITRVNEPNSFTDEQFSGPYTKWQHKHCFEQSGEGIKMVDVVEYAIPFGIIGRLANMFFVQQKLKAIFDYRYNAVEKYFSK